MMEGRRIIVASFAGTALPPIVRVGNSVDVVPAIDRGTSLTSAPSAVHIVRPTVVHVVPKATPPPQSPPKPRITKARQKRSS
jgi:hypothetical protein